MLGKWIPNSLMLGSMTSGFTVTGIKKSREVKTA
jgi:hypothetical protein